MLWRFGQNDLRFAQYNMEVHACALPESFIGIVLESIHSIIHRICFVQRLEPISVRTNYFFNSLVRFDLKPSHQEPCPARYPGVVSDTKLAALRQKVESYKFDRRALDLIAIAPQLIRLPSFCRSFVCYAFERRII